MKTCGNALHLRASRARRRHSPERSPPQPGEVGVRADRRGGLAKAVAGVHAAYRPVLPPPGTRHPAPGTRPAGRAS
ncbi:hypothetical protein AB0F03_37100 [Streptomyces sp. NPDC028722]|uniref:hypothetical protein n=1 Tax=Streptomyces sp. NPDC028722 TaxID=3155016 RepID=UPI0033F23CFC